MSYLYDHGLPFSKGLDEDLDAQIERVNMKKPSLIIIDGAGGTGKTTFCVHIGDYINKKRGHAEVSLDINNHPQIGMGGKDFMQKLAICKEQGLGFCAYDEAGDFAKTGAITGFNAMINRVFETIRTHKIIVAIALPNFNILDNRIFDNEVPRLLIHIDHRGKNDTDYRVFSLTQMNWIRYWFNKLNLAIRKVQSYNNVIENYRGHSLDLPPERSRLLDLLSDKGKTDYLDQAQIKAEGLLSVEMIAAKLGRSDDYTKKSIVALKLKPKMKFKKQKFYSLEDFERLQQDNEKRVLEIQENRSRRKLNISREAL